MKARSWILMLLIGMISFTGHCNTPDLIQNSKTEVVKSLDLVAPACVQIEVQDLICQNIETQNTVCKNLVSDANLVTTYRVHRADGYFDVSIYKDANCETAIATNLIKVDKTITFKYFNTTYLHQVKRLPYNNDQLLKPDLFATLSSSRYSNKIIAALDPKYVFRKSRDGLCYQDLNI